ncbi:MAG: radical SAM protein [Candidatus Omnitrophota bacterium]|jgi:radical SAM protein with 4Fe4S-binding SPASM domain
MKDLDYCDFAGWLDKTEKRIPLYGQIELTYRCPSDCIHCYCTNQPEGELEPSFWKGVIDQVHALGGIGLTFTGGEVFVYPNFLDIYRYARNKGFLINVFTSGGKINKATLDYLEKEPPLSIEITLNSLDRSNYERITRTKGLFDTVMRNIKEMKRRKLPLILKCNGLKENKDEILNIKKFTEELLGKGRFKFDSFVFPGLNGEHEPKAHRLSPKEIAEIENSDSDMIAEKKKQLDHQAGFFNPDGLYHCNSWLACYFINPQGILQPCHLIKECSTDLKKETFKEGFDRFRDLLKLKYKTDSKCIKCELKEFCYKCPARAFLETGNAESPVEYYCELAKAWKNGIRAEV